MGTRRSVVVPSPSWPVLLRPQVHSVPSGLRSTECRQPPSIAPDVITYAATAVSLSCQPERKAFAFNVVAKPSKLDTESWAYISQYGSNAQVLAFLERENVHALNLDLIAFRMRDRDFFSHTDRRMIDGMANNASRVRRYMDRQGVSNVETFVDTCLSVDNLIDPWLPFRRKETRRAPEPGGSPHILP